MKLVWYLGAGLCGLVGIAAVLRVAERLLVGGSPASSLLVQVLIAAGFLGLAGRLVSRARQLK